MAPRTVPSELAAAPEDVRTRPVRPDGTSDNDPATASSIKDADTTRTVEPPEDLLAAFGVKVPAAPAPIVGVLYAVPEDPFRPVGEGADRYRETHEFARGVISPDPTVGDLSIREMEKKGFVRLPADFPVRLAGVQGPSDVMLIRSNERAAHEYAREAAERRARKMGPRTETKTPMDGVTSTVKSNRRAVPRELAGM